MRTRESSELVALDAERLWHDHTYKILTSSDRLVVVSAWTADGSDVPTISSTIEYLQSLSPRKRYHKLQEVWKEEGVYRYHLLDALGIPDTGIEEARELCKKIGYRYALHFDQDVCFVNAQKGKYHPMMHVDVDAYNVCQTFCDLYQQEVQQLLDNLKVLGEPDCNFIGFRNNARRGNWIENQVYQGSGEILSGVC